MTAEITPLQAAGNSTSEEEQRKLPGRERADGSDWNCRCQLTKTSCEGKGSIKEENNEERTVEDGEIDGLSRGGWTGRFDKQRICHLDSSIF